VQIELKDIKAGELVQEYSCAIDEFPAISDLVDSGELKFYPPLAFSLRLQRTGKLVVVEGNLSAEVEFQCGRCLQKYKTAVAESFSFTFAPQPEKCEIEEEAIDEEVELVDSDLGLIFYQDELLELQEPLLEQLLMAIPISPLCKDSCSGLCPECGVNLNNGNCDCVKKVFNNKFNILANLDFKSPE